MSKAKLGDQNKYTKSNLPVKVCKTCSKPMLWRKRWKKVWEQVKYCSEKCRKIKNY
ncbi:MAG: DUF2256 domain-containing protein [Acidobacteriota bacterium]